MSRKRKGWLIYVADLPAGSLHAYEHLTLNQPLAMLPPRTARPMVAQSLLTAYQVAVFGTTDSDIAQFAQERTPRGGSLDWSRKYPLLAYDWAGLPVLHAEKVTYWLNDDDTLAWEREPASAH